MEATFTPNEKEVLEKVRSFRTDMEAILEEQNKVNGEEKSIYAVKYYEDYEFDSKTKDVKIQIKDMYVVIKENGGKLECELYSEDGDLLATVDKNGIEFIMESLKENARELDKNDEKDREKLEDLINTDESKVKDDKLKVISRDATEEEIEENEEELKKNKENDKKPEEEEIEKDLKEDPELVKDREDLDIRGTHQIGDEKFGRDNPKLKSDAFVYSGKLKADIAVIKTSKGYERNKNIHIGKSRTESVISIGKNGSPVVKKYPSMIMKTANPNKEIAVYMDGGYQRFEEVTRTSNGERVSKPIDTIGENNRTDTEVKNKMDTQAENDKIADKYKNDKVDNNTLNNIDDIGDTDEIVLSNGEITTFKKEAEKMEVSIETFRETYEDITANSIEEKLRQTRLEILSRSKEERGKTFERTIHDAAERYYG